MIDSIGVVLPALEKNRYSPFGDLAKFGDFTLLEWKITQLMKIMKKENIYIATPSEKVISLISKYGVTIIKRKNDNMQGMFDTSIREIDKRYLLCTLATSPFIGPQHYISIIKKFFTLDKTQYDSIITVLKMQEYAIYKNAPLNFNINISELRRNIEPVYKLTNGCSLAEKEIYTKYKKSYGIKPYLFEVDKFTAMEINEIDDDAILNDLLAHYFRKDLHIVDKNLWQEENIQ